jgi:predicted secreted protein
MAGKRAFGTVFSYETTTPGTFTALANITNIKPYAEKADIIDVTAHDSAGDYREKIVGALDAGQCVLEMNYDPAAATHAWLQTEFAAKAVHKYKVAWPGSANTATFNAYIVGLSPEAPYDGKLTASVTLEISGAITVT